MCNENSLGKLFIMHLKYSYPQPCVLLGTFWNFQLWNQLVASRFRTDTPASAPSRKELTYGQLQQH